MNFQTFLDPIHAAFMWTFDLLEAGGNNVNYLFMAIIGLLIGYWIMQLLRFNKDEVPNR